MTYTMPEYHAHARNRGCVCKWRIFIIILKLVNRNFIVYELDTDDDYLG